MKDGAIGDQGVADHLGVHQIAVVSQGQRAFGIIDLAGLSIFEHIYLRTEYTLSPNTLLSGRAK